MADITKCKGEGCKIKESCYRFTAIAEPTYQSYFTVIPPKNKSGKCSQFQPNLKNEIVSEKVTNELLTEQLQIKLNNQIIKEIKDMKKAEEISDKKIKSFLKGLNLTEFLYLKHHIDLAAAISTMAKKHNLGSNEICEYFKIKPNQVNALLKGYFNYTLDDICRFNAAYQNLEVKEALKTQAVKVTGEQ